MNKLFLVSLDNKYKKDFSYLIFKGTDKDDKVDIKREIEKLLYSIYSVDMRVFRIIDVKEEKVYKDTIIQACKHFITFDDSIGSFIIRDYEYPNMNILNLLKDLKGQIILYSKDYITYNNSIELVKRYILNINFCSEYSSIFCSDLDNIIYIIDNIKNSEYDEFNIVLDENISFKEINSIISVFKRRNTKFNIYLLSNGSLSEIVINDYFETVIKSIFI